MSTPPPPSNVNLEVSVEKEKIKEIFSNFQTC